MRGQNLIGVEIINREWVIPILILIYRMCMMAKVIPEQEMERRRAEADFELVFAKLSQRSYPSWKESYRAFYMAGRGARKLNTAMPESIKGDGLEAVKETK